jgi:hypothetical protein
LSGASERTRRRRRTARSECAQSSKLGIFSGFSGDSTSQTCQVSKTRQSSFASAYSSPLSIETAAAPSFPPAEWRSCSRDWWYGGEGKHSCSSLLVRSNKFRASDSDRVGAALQRIVIESWLPSISQSGKPAIFIGAACLMCVLLPISLWRSASFGIRNPAFSQTGSARQLNAVITANVRRPTRYGVFNSSFSCVVPIQEGEILHMVTLSV